MFHAEAIYQLQRHGLTVSSLGAPDKIHRTRTEDRPPGVKNGWYVYHVARDGGAFVTFGIWHKGEKQTIRIKGDGARARRHAERNAPDFVRLDDPQAMAEQQAQQAQQYAKARADNETLWGNAHPIADTPAMHYLQGRGITLCAEEITGLRFAPCVPYFENGTAHNLSALLANVQDPAGRTVSILRIYLDPNTAQKAKVTTPKKLTRASAPLKGAFIALTPYNGGVLGIAEGVETALSASQLSGLPVVAGVSAYGMRNFDPPDSCSHLVYFADNDANGTGQRHAQQGAQRVARRGITAQIALPPPGIKDFNDLLQAQA